MILPNVAISAFTLAPNWSGELLTASAPVFSNCANATVTLRVRLRDLVRVRVEARGEFKEGLVAFHGGQRRPNRLSGVRGSQVIFKTSPFPGTPLIARM